MVYFLGKYDFLRRTDKLFFHGLPLSQYLEMGAFMRLEWWLRKNLSFEFAALAMIMLKNNRTATLCHGVMSWADTEARSEYAWVEFTIGMRRYVADFTSGVPGVWLKKEYFGESGVGKNAKPAWKCDYESFWSLDIVRELWMSMHVPEFSYVMQELAAFRPTQYSEMGIENCVCRTGSLFSGGEYMLPYYVDQGRKIVSTEILQEFAKKRTRQQPRTKTIRRAEKEIREYLKGVKAQGNIA